MPDQPTAADLRPSAQPPISPVDAVVAAYDRLAAVDDPGIFLSLVDREVAITRAAAVAGKAKRGPLFGVPFAVKDNIDVAGLPTTAGCPGFAHLPAKSAAVVERLERAGAIVIGKTNLDQFATGLVGVRTPYPVPRNACDPGLVPGGSSSGSAVAVAHGIVSFALGTDTAGSGRVPAALNNIVGLKPSIGAISTRGVLPACRTLDCVSIFAGTVDVAWTAFSAAFGFDEDDPFSRRAEFGRPTFPPKLRIGVPNTGSRVFGSAAAADAFDAALASAAGLAADLRDVDLAPFFEVGALLYGGPWVAERAAALGSFLDRNGEALLPVTRSIIEGGRRFSAVSAFEGRYRLAELARVTAMVWKDIDVLVVPSIPDVVTLDEIAADPIGANARLGTYTNFVNLLDLCALAIPGPRRRDGLPAGVTLIGRAGTDALLAALGERLHGASATPIGATGRLPSNTGFGRADVPAGMIPIAVVGAHLSGMALNGELTGRGASFVRAAKTEASYRLYALPGGPPYRPGLVRVGTGGMTIDVEVWAMPPQGFADLVAGIPSPLGLGTLRLDDGTTVKGYLCEQAAAMGARDISAYGGWRAYVAAG